MVAAVDEQWQRIGSRDRISGWGRATRGREPQDDHDSRACKSRKQHANLDAEPILPRFSILHGDAVKAAALSVERESKK